MIRYSTCLRTLFTLLIVLAGFSTSEAGLFGRWRGRDVAPAPAAAATVATPATAAIPPTGKTAVPTAGPRTYTVAKPVISATPAGAAATAAPAAYYVPAQAVSPSTGWSTLPRSSWDFGKYPPYNN